MKYVRNMLVLLLIGMIALPSAAFASGYTAYTNQRTYVYRKASTSSAKVSIKANTKLTVTGTQGSFFRVKKSGNTGYVLKNCISKKSSTSWKSKVIRKDWFKGGSKILKRNAYGMIYDISTGITLRIKRMGGTNHADVEPASSSDTVKLLKVAGGKFSWDAHAVILNAGGKYVACSINTMPHGDQTIKNNNYNGQFCLHMTNSITHGTETVNANHQAAIEKAYAWAHY